MRLPALTYEKGGTSWEMMDESSHQGRWEADSSAGHRHANAVDGHEARLTEAATTRASGGSSSVGAAHHAASATGVGDGIAEATRGAVARGAHALASGAFSLTARLRAEGNVAGASGVLGALGGVGREAGAAEGAVTRGAHALLALALGAASSGRAAEQHAGAARVGLAVAVEDARPMMSSQVVSSHMSVPTASGPKWVSGPFAAMAAWASVILCATSSSTRNCLGFEPQSPEASHGSTKGKAK
eukprot:CAMPEP_0206452784 /NCGR_PEP_ID=MMETSP0324_2-20121206/20155_1 /ASSEMBLY_ACC=CAM_ASM_000836 /TAXON_ID=2866 /ORGANISM="Crypthecodinium cohnii, Strain Seligo" /LENGTH=243 /DNA_ID=CAMNT_0053922947 /DNA_START=293 /DNA_END=1026 /DNA_ORIENTATION=+